MPEAAELPAAGLAIASTPETAMSTFDKYFPEGEGGPKDPTASPEEVVAEPPKVTPPAAKTEAPKEPPTGLRKFSLEAPKVEVPVEDDFEKLANEERKGQIKGEDYRKLQDATRKKVEALSSELAALKAEAEGLRKSELSPAAKSEMDSLKQRISKYEETLERKYYQESPAFEKKFGQRTASLDNAIGRVAKEFNISDEDMSALIAASPKRRAQLLSGMDDEIDKGALSTLLVQRDILEEEKKVDVSRSREEIAAQQREQEELSQQEIQRLKESDQKVFRTQLEEAQEVLPAFQKRANDPAWEAKRQGYIQAAENLFMGKETPERMVQVALLGIAYEELHNRFVEQQASEARKDELLARYKGSTTNGGNPPGEGHSTAGMTEEQRAMATYDKYLNAMNPGFQS